MSNQRLTHEATGKVPAYIVTFSDMVTLLLTFFVMLLSLAKTQDAAMLHAGREAFVERLNSIGLGMLPGRGASLEMGKVKIKYYIKEPDTTTTERTIDAKEEDLRRIFNKISKSVTSMSSQITSKKTNFSVTNIRFSQGDARLNDPAKKFLSQFSMDLQHTTRSGAIRLYVLGLAGDERTEKKQWILSAQRAKAVADYLVETLPSELNWPIYSWGAGPGGSWTNKDSMASEQSQILIAVLRTGY